MKQMGIIRWIPVGALGATGLLVAFITACAGVDPGGEEQFELLQQSLSGGSGGSGPITFDLQQTTGAAGSGTGGSYSGATDATIYAAFATTNFGSSDTCTVDGGSMERACLFRWEMPLPDTATVTAASIILTLSNGTSSSFNVHNLLKPWTEGTVTWNNNTALSRWTIGGAKADNSANPDRSPNVLGTLTGGAGQRTINLNTSGIAVVQSWMTDPDVNHGIIIAGNSTDGVHINSSESTTIASRPILRVTYQP
jgi:hypothetical protein